MIQCSASVCVPKSINLWSCGKPHPCSTGVSVMSFDHNELKVLAPQGLGLFIRQDFFLLYPQVATVDIQDFLFAGQSLQSLEEGHTDTIWCCARHLGRMTLKGYLYEVPRRRACLSDRTVRSSDGVSSGRLLVVECYFT